MRRMLTLAAGAALALTACDGGGGATPTESAEPSAAVPSSGAPSSTPSGTPSVGLTETSPSPGPSTPASSAPAGRLFTAADAEGLNLQQDPPGMTFLPDSSGPTTLDDATSPDQASAIRQAGGVLAMHARAWQSSRAPEASPQGAFYVFTIAMVLPDEATASTAFSAFRDDPNPIFLGYQSDDAPGLGDEGFVFAAEHELGDPPERHPEVGYVWRNGNAVLFIQFIGVPGGAGDIDAAALRDAALTMDQVADVMRGG